MKPPATRSLDEPWNIVSPLKAEGRRAIDALFAFLLFAYASLLLVWLAIQPLPPLQDYEDWVYQGWVGAGLLMRQPSVWAKFAIVHYPVPNSASQVLLAVLTSAVGPLLSAKVFIGLLLVGFAVVCYLSALRWKMDSPGVSAFILFVLFGVNAMFWDGYVNYQLSILVFFCFLLLRKRSSAAWILVTGLVLFFCHASTFFAFVLLVLLESIADRKSILSLSALSPSLALLLWYVLARGKNPMPNQPALYSGLVHHVEYKAYTLSKSGPFHNLGDFTGHSLASRAHTFYLAGAALNLAFAILLLCAIVSLLIRQPRRDSLFLTAAVLFSLFLVLPDVIFNVVNLGERMLYPCLAVILFSLRSFKFPKLLAVMSVCGAALTAAQFLTMPVAKSSNAAAESRIPSARIPDYVQFGLYNSDLYRFDSYRVFLEHPNTANMPQLGFETSLLRDHTSRNLLPDER
jgi:hypothetical protein